MGLYWGGVEFFSYPQSGCTLFTEYTHLGDKVEEGIKIITGMQVTGKECHCQLKRGLDFPFFNFKSIWRGYTTRYGFEQMDSPHHAKKPDEAENQQKELD